MGLDVKRADEIRRKADVDEETWTKEKARAADWIEEHILSEGKWPMNMAEIAREADGEWTRQHIANTVEAFFEPVIGVEDIGLSTRGADRFDSVFEAYLAGLEEGYELRKREEQSRES